MVFWEFSGMDHWQSHRCQRCQRGLQEKSHSEERVKKGIGFSVRLWRFEKLDQWSVWSCTDDNSRNLETLERGATCFDGCLSATGQLNARLSQWKKHCAGSCVIFLSLITLMDLHALRWEIRYYLPLFDASRSEYSYFCDSPEQPTHISSPVTGCLKWNSNSLVSGQTTFPSTISSGPIGFSG